MKQLLQGKRCAVLQHGAAQRANQKKLPNGKPGNDADMMKNDGSHHGTAAVDRAYGTEKESSVLPVVFFACAVDTLKDPSDNTEKKKLYEIDRDDQKGLLSMTGKIKQDRGPDGMKLELRKPETWYPETGKPARGCLRISVWFPRMRRAYLPCRPARLLC